MASYEDRWIGGSKYTVPVGTRSDWRPGQAYNLPTSTAPATSTLTTTTTRPSLSSRNSDYGKTWGPGITSPSTPTTTASRFTQTVQQPVNQPRIQQTMQNSFPYEQMLRDLLSQPSSYKAPSESELLSQARQYATLQVDPLLSAIQSSLAKTQSDYESQRQAIEAAYSGVPARTQSLLEEARQAALASAVARGMGRSGVPDWLTAKLSTPIMQQATESDQEKAAKLAAAANALATAQSEAGRQRQATEERRGTLESARLAELRQQALQHALSQQSTTWGQALGLANLAQGSNTAQQQLINQLIPLLLYG